jgi:hypothetical protein
MHFLFTAGESFRAITQITTICREINFHRGITPETGGNLAFRKIPAENS